MPSRVEAEALIRALIGGSSPNAGDIIIFDPTIGWTFRQFSGGGTSSSPGSSFNIDDLNKWPGSTKIKILGTIEQGVWQGTPIQASWIGPHKHDVSDFYGNTRYSGLPGGTGTWDIGSGEVLTLTGLLELLEGAKIKEGQKIYLDDDLNSYIYCSADDVIDFYTNNALVARLTTTDLIVGSVVTGNLQCDGIINDSGLAAGTYAPTRSAESNLDSNVSPTNAQYMRVGGVITVSGRFTADPTGAGAASFQLSVPIASTFSSGEHLSGVAFSGGIAGQGAEIKANTTNHTAQFNWIAVDTSSKDWSYTYTYRVI